MCLFFVFFWFTIFVFEAGFHFLKITIKSIEAFEILIFFSDLSSTFLIEYNGADVYNLVADFFVFTEKVVIFVILHVFQDINLCCVINVFYIVVVDSSALAFLDF